MDLASEKMTRCKFARVRGCRGAAVKVARRPRPSRSQSLSPNRQSLLRRHHLLLVPACEILPVCLAYQVRQG